MYRLIRWMDVDLTKPMLTVYIWLAWLTMSALLLLQLLEVRGWRVNTVLERHPYPLLAYLTMLVIVGWTGRKNPMELVTVNVVLVTISMLLTL